MGKEPEGGGSSLAQDGVSGEDDVPEGRGGSLAQDDGVKMSSDEEDLPIYLKSRSDAPEGIGNSKAPVVPVDDILEYDITLPEDTLEYDISLPDPISKGYERKSPPSPLSPALKEPPNKLYQPPGFFRSHRRLNV